jgi:hypothetical protein
LKWKVENRKSKMEVGNKKWKVEFKRKVLWDFIFNWASEHTEKQPMYLLYLSFSCCYAVLSVAKLNLFFLSPYSDRSIKR